MQKHLGKTNNVNFSTLGEISSTWYFLNTFENDGKFNMACDNYLLKSLIQNHFKYPILRVYAWSTPTLSLGFSQKENKKEIKYTIPCVRRMTGGQAVMHLDINNEITYSIVLKSSKNFKEIYYAMGNILLYLLESYGLNGVFGYSNKNYAKDFNCFNTQTLSDIVVDNIKIVGSAQYRKKEYILQHGAIRLDLINKLIGQNISFHQVARDLRNIFQKRIDINLIEMQFTNDDYDLIESRLC